MSQRAYVLIEAQKGQADTVAAELMGKQGILSVDRVFGRHDIVAVIEAEDLDGLVMIIRNEIAPAEHVVRTETLVVTSSTNHQR
jgi:DNA-binding Lrp family transcriptional regulator